METFSVAEAKRRFSELLDRVAQGERFVVERRGRPAVALIPVDETTEEDGQRYRGALSMVGALADVEGFDELMREIVASRQRASDRPPPDLG